MRPFPATDEPHPADWPQLRLPLQLSSAVVHVVRIDLDLPESCWRPWYSLLSPAEITRAERYRFDKPRQSFVICRAALRMLLGAACGCPPDAVTFIYGPHGKPALAPCADAVNPLRRLEFSVSHSGSLGLIALGVDCSIGVDLEELNPQINALKLAGRYFAPPEVDELNSLSAEQIPRGFFRGWTCKEAFIKATGRGLSQRLSSFCVAMNPDQPARLVWDETESDAPQHWTLTAIHASYQHAAALAVRRSACRIECWQWRPPAPTESD